MYYSAFANILQYPVAICREMVVGAICLPFSLISVKLYAKKEKYNKDNSVSAHSARGQNY